MRSNKSKIIFIATAFMAAALIVFGVAMLVKMVTNSPDENENPDNPITLNSDDLKDVAEEVKYGDYDKMSEVAHAIINGVKLGQVVKADGLVSCSLFSCSVIEKNADGTEGVGIQFIIEGISDEEYPKDGDRIEITGKVTEDETLYYVIRTLPEYVIKK